MSEAQHPSDEGQQPRHIAVCALTYLRPDGLTALLAGLAALDVPDGIDVVTVIVDNDPDASASDTVATAPTAPTPITYVHEPRRGISHARNRAVATALEAGADAVCFIDDDEVPATDWLAQLIATQRATDADVVTGPVFPVFESEPPAWIVEGGFFERRRHEHHEQINYATTSSVLIMRRCLDDRPEPFAIVFGLSGGEDTHLFAQLREAGFRTVWCDLAHVHETIPDSRIDKSWLRKREYRRGQTLSLSLRDRTSSPWKLIRRAGNGVQHALRGCVERLLAVRGSEAKRLAAEQHVLFGLGMLSGLTGQRYQEYTTTHGS